jgi:uncharacterized protein
MIARLSSSGPSPALDVEPFRLAREEAVLDVQLGPEAFPRVAECVESVLEPVHVEVAFRRDAQGRCLATGSLRTRVRLRCANCLETEPCGLAAEVDLCVVRSEASARELIEEVDTVVIEQATATAAELFEDDLLLALPERPCAELESCVHAEAYDAFARSGDEAEPAPEREHPFAALAALKGTKAGDGRE